MDTKAQVREFLSSRRARITPAQAGLPAYGGNRRVSGLRREEVAMLSGMSVDYYTRMERGNLTGVSESVLGALAATLQLDEAERAHLADLARAANTDLAKQARTRRAPRRQVRPEVQRILDSMDSVPAMVRNDRRDVLATNTLGGALYSELFSDPMRPVNIARFTFLDPRAQEFFLDWPGVAADIVASLHTVAGRDPFDRELTALIGELTTRSQDFARLWASHNVRFHRSGTKAIHHPVVGDLHLVYESMEIPTDAGLSLIVYTAEPGTAAADGLALLATWAATRAQETVHPVTPADSVTNRPGEPTPPRG